MKLVTVKYTPNGVKRRVFRDEAEYLVSNLQGAFTYSTKGAYKSQEKDLRKAANRPKKKPNPFGFKAYKRSQERNQLKPISLERSRQVLLELWNRMGARGLKRKAQALKKWYYKDTVSKPLMEFIEGKRSRTILA